ncbi:DUF4760 domain-containing protein [Pseudomonas aeruginosa]|uniref:DUF4760 domain-containing protein n=1 Tax=Pseudomonas aeruginosa TaxID=287 RepID=UPI000FFCB3C7|nr:DUF4760 domain-containing protein [Pseudomonas aeruginosa]MBA5619015.1 DUF4760 domain-containing protein [Pseudomonas aeruginosa]MDH7950358.1 DUF4760 domain-containing protein [Pseudomonas aeruginosa]RMK83479.1 hypothetical protein IPC86_00985 [Pseudomonas aeruginosa]HCL3904944.1 DUF4760 domain-containing protein [Pseudomonas aeruginosa]HEJ1743625.1 DUF4760 domain-containing protein [Pseudomonas aeruginosa]
MDVSLTWETCKGFLECTNFLLGTDVFRNVSFLFGVLVAIVSVLSAKTIARKKQAADLLFNSRGDEELQNGLRALAKMHDDGNTNMRAFAAKSRVDEDIPKMIRYVLNHYEYVAVGVQSKIYDEGMLRSASFNTVINLYKHSKPFIEAVRDNNQRPTIYQEFQWLAKRWEEKGLPVKKRPPVWKFW